MNPPIPEGDIGNDYGASAPGNGRSTNDEYINEDNGLNEVPNKLGYSKFPVDDNGLQIHEIVEPPDSYSEIGDQADKVIKEKLDRERMARQLRDYEL